MVYKRQYVLHMFLLDVLQENNRVLARNRLQDLLEIRTARRQYHLVRLEQLPIASDGHVDELLLFDNILYRNTNALVKVLTSQHILLLFHFGWFQREIDRFFVSNLRLVAFFLTSGRFKTSWNAFDRQLFWF